MGTRGRGAMVAIIVVVASALRVALAVVRDPFFDELLSVWYAAKPLSEHWRFLLEDSAAPLYYAVARIAYLVGATSVDGLRIISLVAALLMLGLLLRTTDNREPATLVAPALLAVFPAHVFFSTEARAYGLAGLLVGVGVLGLDRWRRDGKTAWLLGGMAGLVLAAYTHWYGVLLFPLPFLVGLLSRNRRLVIGGLAGAAAAGLLFIPGFRLASLQPLDAIAWMGNPPMLDRLRQVAGSLLQLGFAAPYPAVFQTPPPAALRILSVILVVPVAVLGMWRSVDARIFGTATLLPLLGVAGFALAGSPVYFPMRFESVLSVPLVLWLGYSWTVLRGGIARLWLSAILTLGFLVSAGAIVEHAGRESDPYRQAAQFARHTTDSRMPIVASGYAYLEVISQAGPEWRPLITAFPQRQAIHPGWSERVSLEELSSELRGLPDSFVWIGTLHSPEAQVISERYQMEERFSSGPVVAALAVRRP